MNLCGFFLLAHFPDWFCNFKALNVIIGNVEDILQKPLIIISLMKIKIALLTKWSTHVRWGNCTKEGRRKANKRMRLCYFIFHSTDFLLNCLLFPLSRFLFMAQCFKLINISSFLSHRFFRLLLILPLFYINDWSNNHLILWHSQIVSNLNSSSSRVPIRKKILLIYFNARRQVGRRKSFLSYRHINFNAKLYIG